MFGWFRKKRPPKLSGEIEVLANRFLEPPALAVVMAELVRDYANAVKAGRVSSPAHRRKDLGHNASASRNRRSGLADVRMEALLTMFGFGQSDLFMLAERGVSLNS